MADFKDTFTRTVAQAEQLRRAQSQVVLSCPAHNLVLEPGPGEHDMHCPDEDCPVAVRVTIATEEKAK